MKIFKLISALAISFFSLQVFAQNKPIGYWRSHMPYNSAIGVATDGTKLFVVCNESFFTFETRYGGGLNAYSKVDGMSDVGMQAIAYDAATSTAILAYSNSNIDLFQNNTFYNLPDLKIKNLALSKNINSIYPENGFAFLSTDIGIIVLDLANKNIKETYTFTINNQTVPIYAFTASGGFYYAVTGSGLYRASKNSPQLQNFAVWQLLDSVHQFKCISSTSNGLFVATKKVLFAVIKDTLPPHTNDILIPIDSLTSLKDSSTSYYHLDPGINSLLISEYDSAHYNDTIKKMDFNYHFEDSFCVRGGKCGQIVQILDSSIWIADQFNGLRKRNSDNTTGFFFPPGPNDANAYDIYAYNKDVWVAHGGFDDKYVALGNIHGVSNLKNDQWVGYEQYQYYPFSDSMSDFTNIIKDQATGTVYMGSFQDGLFTLNPDGTFSILKQNSIFDHSGPNALEYQVFGLAFDKEGDLWVTLYGSPHMLYVKTKAGDWFKFSVPYDTHYPNAAGQIIVDDNDYVWYICPSADLGGGLVVYNFNGTPGDASDDQSRQLVSGVGYGNLPSDRTLCIAKDKNNDIWVGTTDGIGIISCGSSVFQNGCDGSIPIVQYDQYAGYLFKGENVRSIAVDGANRKWVGTDNGIWLLSSDASQIIYRFTQDNSPLPSNLIEKISIDPITGDVYIGTQKGMVSYHGTATDGGVSNQNVIVFPDPVPGNYSGTVAIKGLVANADVRITDITGQLVFRTTALGGQAVWNGKDYQGHRPEPGVYLIFVTNKDGSETYAGKMVLTQ